MNATTSKRLLFALLMAVSATLHAQEVRVKELGRFLGWRDNMLVGYGLVTGLAGTGDSSRSRPTRQALSNLLSQFELAVPQDQIQSRNVAAVMLTATLPASSNIGDKMDITVTSIGDARSLAGGTLMMAPLRGPDRQTYALAQGAVSVGGYRYDANGNVQQKNHPTVGLVVGGGSVETPVRADLVAKDGYLTFILKDADSTTAERIAQRINASFGAGTAQSNDAGTIKVRQPGDGQALNQFVARIEALTVSPDRHARVVINERTGTVVAGADVQIAAVAISQGDIRVSISTEFAASQPNLIAGAGPDVRSLVVGNSRLTVDEGPQSTSAVFPSTTVATLVQTLNKMRVSTRDVIAILQAIKTAGALYADIIVQ